MSDVKKYYIVHSLGNMLVTVALYLLMLCLPVWALSFGQGTTGHLIVSFTDKKTGGPITNIIVTVETLNCLGPNAGVYESHYTKTSAMTDSNTIDGLAKYNELKALDDDGDYIGYAAKFEPESVTHTTNAVYRADGCVSIGALGCGWGTGHVWLC